jgi:hypothetical protein
MDPGPWSWLPTPEEIRRMSEDELLALKRRIGEQLAAQSQAGLVGPCAEYWRGGPMPALNCRDALRRFAVDYRGLLAQLARSDPEAWSWIPSEAEIDAMSEAELIAFKQAGDRQLGFDPTPAPEPPPAGPCAAFWEGGPMPALNCQEALQALANTFLTDVLGPLAASNPEPWSWLPSAEEIGSMSEGDLIAFKQQAEGQLVEEQQPANDPGLCGTYWSGGSPPAMDCRDEFEDLAIRYRQRLLDPLAEADPEQWSWLPTDEEIGAMSEDELRAFRLRAMKQLGT